MASSSNTNTPDISRAASFNSFDDEELIEYHPPTAFFSIHDPKRPEPIYVSPVFVHEAHFGADLDFDRDHRDLQEVAVVLWLEDSEEQSLFRPTLVHLNLSCLRYIGQDEAAAQRPSQLVVNLDDGCFIPAPPAFTHQTSSSGLRTPAELLSASTLDQMLKVLNMEHMVKDAELTRAIISKEVEALTKNRELLTMAEHRLNYTTAEIDRVKQAQQELGTRKFKLDQQKAKLAQDIETRRAYLKSGSMLQKRAKLALENAPADLPEQVAEEKLGCFQTRKEALIQLTEIFPISHAGSHYTIAGLSLTSSDEHEQTFAYSITCELLLLLSGLFEIPLKYPISRVGAHHAIFDPVSIITGSRAFPLFPSSLPYRFEYAVLLLNKDIQMFLELLKIPIADGRETLGMLAILLAVNT